MMLLVLLLLLFFFVGGGLQIKLEAHGHLNYTPSTDNSVSRISNIQLFVKIYRFPPLFCKSVHAFKEKVLLCFLFSSVTFGMTNGKTFTKGLGKRASVQGPPSCGVSASTVIGSRSSRNASRCVFGVEARLSGMRPTHLLLWNRNDRVRKKGDLVC